jgi:hypothetical protein
MTSGSSDSPASDGRSNFSVETITPPTETISCLGKGGPPVSPSYSCAIAWRLRAAYLGKAKRIAPSYTKL